MGPVFSISLVTEKLERMFSIYLDYSFKTVITKVFFKGLILVKVTVVGPDSVVR